jgi:1-acyl-sn-glycerol-3-phosphate acyltransferase
MDNMPKEKIRNYPLYLWRIFGKLLSFFIFGVGTVLLLVFFFPAMTLICRTDEDFKTHGRRVVSKSWSFLCLVMRILRVTEVRLENKDLFKNLSSKIIVTNHPSLLDVVILIALIPNADCIVNDALRRTIVGGIVRRLYILNSLDFSELSQKCVKTLDAGNCLVIFPEGSRTPRTGHIPLKRGAARLAILSGRSIVPVHIGGTDKWGLGKKEPMLSFNPNEKYMYAITVKDEINPAAFADFPVPAAARRITAEIERRIFEGDKNDE